MSANREIRSVRCEDLLKELVKSGSCVFFTLTTPDVVDYEEIRRRWRLLRHDLVRRLGRGVKYVMNYEIHPKGHGWHIHGVFNIFVSLRRFLPLIRKYGFGRVDFRRVTSVGVAEYLTKHCLKAYRGVKRQCSTCGRRLRLVNTSRGLPKLDDYFYRSTWLDDFRSVGSGVFPVVRATSSFRPCLFWARLAADLKLPTIWAARDFVANAFLDDFTKRKLVRSCLLPC